MEVVWPILLGFGIPSGIFGLIIWYLKKKIDKNEEKTAERQSNLEQLVLMMIQSYVRLLEKRLEMAIVMGI